jgi:toxin ParE1/3/4
MVRWSGPAKKDLRRIFDYIAEDSIYYANSVAQTIVDKSESLNAFPQMGRKVPEIGESNVREIFIYSYRLIYEPSGEDIHVLAIIHGKQDLERSKPDLFE